jgi:hypothetical protein
LGGHGLNSLGHDNDLPYLVIGVEDAMDAMDKRVARGNISFKIFLVCRSRLSV